MNLKENSITESGNFTNQFVFQAGLGTEDLLDNPLSRLSREQLAAFLNAESSNARSGHFSAAPAEPPPPTPERSLAVGVLKQAAYDLRRFRTATKGGDREVYLDAHSWITAYDSTWPYSFVNVCKLLDVCPDIVREELLADASLGAVHYWVRRAGRLSRKLRSSVARVFEGGQNPDSLGTNQVAVSI